MKKLLSIVISAITLGVFADAGNTPMTFELPEGLAAGTEVSLVCNGEVVHTTTATSDSITYSTEGLAAGEYWLELAGEPITESLMIGASASAPQFASAKYALAIEPVAVWEDLTGADQEGGLTYEGTSFTLSANGNTVAENGTIAIGSTGIKVTNFPENTSAFTIVVKYSGYTAPTESGTKAVIATAKNSANANRIGVYAGVGVTHGIWNGADNGSDVTGGLATEGIFALAYASDGKPGTALIQKGATALVFNNDGLKATGNNYDEVVIGAFNGSSTTYTPSAMTIEKVAVFASKLTQDDIDAFVFPSEDTTEVFDGTLPSADDIARFQAESWVGTVWIKNRTNWNGFDLNSYGNANSTVRLTGITGYNAQGSHVTPTVELVDETDANGNVTKKALEIRNGWTGSLVIIDKLIGSGTLDVAAGPVKTLIKDSSEFKGVAKVTIDGEAGLIFGNVDSVPVAKGCVYDKKITIVGETPVEIHNAWTAPQGIVVNGTLNVPSTVAIKGLKDDMLIAKGGVVNVERNDWVDYNASADKTIKVIGTLNCGTNRQSFGSHNKLVVVAGATITGAGDGEGAIDNFGGATIKIEAATGDNAPTTVEWSANTRYRSQPDFEVAEGVTVNMSGNVFPETGYTKTVNKTGLGTLNLTGTVAAGITHKLSAGTITSNSDALNVTSGVEGKVIDVKTAEGVTTYMLVDESSGPQTIEDITAENVMDVVPEAIQTADAGKLASWIKETSGITSIDDLSSINVNCFLMGVENSETDPELVIDENTLAAVLSGDVEALKAIYPNAEVTIEDVTSTICGEGADENTHLYQLKLSLPTAQN